MKVLFITHYSGLYGANKSLLQLVIELREYYNVNAHVIVPEEGVFVEELKLNDIPFTKSKFYNWLNIDRSWIKKAIKKSLNVYLFWKIDKRITNIRFDIVHTNSSATNLGGYLSKKNKRPHVWHFREYGKADYNLSYYCGLKNACKYINKRSNLIISISKDLKTYYSGCLDPNKIRVIYNGIKGNLGIRKTYNLTRPLNICILGVITSNKNQRELLKACRFLLRNKYNNDFLLHIVGDGKTKEIEYLKQFVDDNEMDNNVVFTGYVANVEKILPLMDIGVVCSKREAFGRVTIEFMMNKIPVIVCDTGANPEIVQSEEIGILYPHGDFKELGKQILKFIEKRSLLRQTGEKAFEFAHKNFSSETNTRNIYNSYKELLTKE